MNQIKHSIASGSSIEDWRGTASDAAASADALQALREMQAEAAAQGLDIIGVDEIDAEIDAHRRERASAKD